MAECDKEIVVYVDASKSLDEAYEEVVRLPGDPQRVDGRAPSTLRDEVLEVMGGLLDESLGFFGHADSVRVVVFGRDLGDAEEYKRGEDWSEFVKQQIRNYRKRDSNRDQKTDLLAVLRDIDSSIHGTGSHRARRLYFVLSDFWHDPPVEGEAQVPRATSYWEMKAQELRVPLAEHLKDGGWHELDAKSGRSAEQDIVTLIGIYRRPKSPGKYSNISMEVDLWPTLVDSWNRSYHVRLGGPRESEITTRLKATLENRMAFPLRVKVRQGLEERLFHVSFMNASCQDMIVERVYPDCQALLPEDDEDAWRGAKRVRNIPVAANSQWTDEHELRLSGDCGEGRYRIGVVPGGAQAGQGVTSVVQEAYIYTENRLDLIEGFAVLRRNFLLFEEVFEVGLLVEGAIVKSGQENVLIRVGDQESFCAFNVSPEAGGEQRKGPWLLRVRNCQRDNVKIGGAKAYFELSVDGGEVDASFYDRALSVGGVVGFSMSFLGFLFQVVSGNWKNRIGVAFTYLAVSFSPALAFFEPHLREWGLLVVIVAVWPLSCGAKLLLRQHVQRRIRKHQQYDASDEPNGAFEYLADKGLPASAAAVLIRLGGLALIVFLLLEASRVDHLDFVSSAGYDTVTVEAIRP